MSDFIREVDDELRQDQFKRILNRYWMVLVAAVVLILAGVGAWRAMDYVSTQKAEAVGGQYMDALALARDGKSAEAIAALQTVVQDGPPGYKLLARFRIAAETGVTDKAAGAKLYDALAADPAVDAALQNVARIRAGLLLIDTLPYADVQQRLAPLADANGTVRNEARELLALAALKADKMDEAGRLLDAIETDPTSSASLRQRAERLLGLVKSAGTAPPPPNPPASNPPASTPAAEPPDAAPPADPSSPDRSTEVKTFSVAIIGRPNVGKSTLFNRLVGKKLALVDDQPGVTRDRREGEAKLGDLRFTIIDTAGLEEGDGTTLTGRMRAQTEAAVLEADAIFFMIDARVGLTPVDHHFASLVRRADKPLILLANKAEGRAGTAGAYEAFDLGLGEPVALSAEHGDGFAELYDSLLVALPEATAPDPEEDEVTRERPLFDDEEDGTELDPTKPLGIAVIGRPNAGKSTLLNRLLGEDRLLTSAEPGTTRDAIGLDVEWRGRHLKIFDTAGMRKRARIEDKLEKLAVADALRAARFAEVVIVLLDATIPFEKQDLTIVDLVEREGRGLVIGLNKWDLIEQRGARLSELKEEADRLLPQIKGTPVVPVSGLTGQGMDKLIEAVIRVHETWNKRISTGKLNRWLMATVDATPPPAVSGRRIKLRYMTQPKARPPSFVLFGNQLKDLPTSYQRFLVNGLRQAFDLPGVPIRLSTRQGENPYDKRKKY